MNRLLWVGDAACDSGFATCTHQTLETLRFDWDVSVLGLNHLGDPHEYPYKIYPCWPGGDLFGVRRLPAILRKVQPHVVVIQNDPWNIPSYTHQVQKVYGDGPRPTLVGAIAVDGEHCNGAALNDLDHVIFWTRFAHEQALMGGFTKTAGVVPLGVDLNVFQPSPLPKAEMRRMLGLPEETFGAFIVLNVNRNQPRKRLDLTVRYFAKWYHAANRPNAFLYLHTCPTGEDYVDINALAGYYGLRGRVILAEPPAYHGASLEEVARTYQAADVQVSTTQGEGWGLTTMEGMACGVPQIVPQWSALGEWTDGAAKFVPCSSVSISPGQAIGGVADEGEFVMALNALFAVPSLRYAYRDMGLALVKRDEYRWDAIGAAFGDEVAKAVCSRRK